MLDCYNAAMTNELDPKWIVFCGVGLLLTLFSLARLVWHLVAVLQEVWILAFRLGILFIIIHGLFALMGSTNTINMQMIYQVAHQARNYVIHFLTNNKILV